MKEALGPSEMSVLTRATQRNIPEDSILNNLIRSVANARVVCSQSSGVFLKWRNHKMIEFIETCSCIRWLMAKSSVCFPSTLPHILVYNKSTKLSPFGSVASFPNYSNKFECVGSVQH
jgi:hypothetical protein